MGEENTGAPVDVPNEENHQEEATTETDKATMNNEMSSNSDVDVDEVLDSWSEDRNRNSELERENFNLKKQLSEKSNDDYDEDELDRDEWVSREIERREKLKADERELESKLASKTKSALRIRNPYFRKNEQRVVQLSEEGNMSLQEAIKILKTRDGVAKDTINEADDKRKKNASQDTSKKSTGTVGTSKYDPKVDGEKSISELFRENL